MMAGEFKRRGISFQPSSFRWKLKIAFYYLLFFFLLYNETIKVAGVSLSILWKIPILVYIFFVVIKRKFNRPRFNRFAYGYGIIKLFNKGLVSTTFTAISDFSRYITFPLLYDFISYKVRDSKFICRLLFHVSQFTVLSFVPFILGLLHSKKEMDLTESALEIQEVAGRTSGIFNSPHAASALLALCIVFLVYYLSHQSHKRERYYVMALIAIGIWAIILTYARGGWVMLLVGSFIVLARKSPRFIVSCVVVGACLFVGVSYLMQHNEYFYNRITDRNEKGEKNSSSRVGSGRLWFAENGIEFWMESNDVQEFLTGQGILSLMEYQEKKTGLYIYCHNGYVDSLAQNGIIGFYCMVGLSVCMFIFVYKNKRYRHRKFCVSVMVMYITFQALQGGAAPYSDFFYALVLHLARLEQAKISETIAYRKAYGSI